MSLSQQKFREMVFQLLYSKDVGNPPADTMIELMMEQLTVSKRNVKLAQERIQRLLDQLPEIDRLISSVSSSYDFDRIQIVTKNILRLGVFELLFDDEIPPKVAIAEAMRLARKFGTPESTSFVNALLDCLYQASLGKPKDTKNLDSKALEFKDSEEIAKKIAEEAILTEPSTLEKPSLEDED